MTCPQVSILLFPTIFFYFKKGFYLLNFTDFCQHLTLSLDFSLSQFGAGGEMYALCLRSLY